MYCTSTDDTGTGTKGTDSALVLMVAAAATPTLLNLPLTHPLHYTTLTHSAHYSTEQQSFTTT